jgi:hypothetical protein
LRSDRHADRQPPPSGGGSSSSCLELGLYLPWVTLLAVPPRNPALECYPFSSRTQAHNPVVSPIFGVPPESSAANLGVDAVTGPPAPPGNGGSFESGDAVRSLSPGAHIRIGSAPVPSNRGSRGARASALGGSGSRACRRSRIAPPGSPPPEEGAGLRLGTAAGPSQPGSWSGVPSSACIDVAGFP